MNQKINTATRRPRASKSTAAPRRRTPKAAPSPKTSKRVTSPASTAKTVPPTNNKAEKAPTVILKVLTEILEKVATADSTIKRKTLLRDITEHADALWDHHLFSDDSFKGRKQVLKATHAFINVTLDCRDTIERKVKVKEVKSVGKGKASSKKSQK